VLVASAASKTQGLAQMNYVAQSQILIAVSKEGQIMVNCQGNVAPAMLIYGCEILKKKILEQMEQASPVAFNPRKVA
jgi:hypothetical protein